MYAIDELVVGTFYWVLPEVDHDAEWRKEWQPGEEWRDYVQPARFAGRNAQGELLWNFVDGDGCSNWPVLWVGDPIQRDQYPMGTSLIGRLRRKPD